MVGLWQRSALGVPFAGMPEGVDYSPSASVRDSLGGFLAGAWGVGALKARGAGGVGRAISTIAVAMLRLTPALAFRYR